VVGIGSAAPAPGATATPGGRSGPGDRRPRRAHHRTILPPATVDGTTSVGAVSVDLPDGRTVVLDRPVIVGRNPDPALGPPAALPVAIADPSISKTHAVITPADGQVWVTDLHSTNGTAVDTAGTVAPCAPGERCRVEPGGTIVAGDVRLLVRGGS
jgi:hypothetical protein